MKALFKKTLACAAAVAVCLPVAAQRDTVNMDFAWRFHIGDSAATGNGQTVNLPHDFQRALPWTAPDASERPDESDMAANVRSRLSARGFKEMCVGWYAKTLRPDDSWRDRRVTIDFGGIMLVGDVYLNGRRIGGTDYGYVGFGIDITDKLVWGEDNTIVVRADTGGADNSRWYTGGGLFRSVRLVITPKDAYFDRHPLKITADTTGRVAIEAEVYANGRGRRHAFISTKITDAEGNVVASGVTPAPFNAKRRRRTFRADTLTVDNPRLWSCDEPTLYTAEVCLTDSAMNAIDRVSARFGMRTVEYSPEYGFKLNGRKVLFKGLANHNELGALGSAAFPRAIEKRIETAKQFGFNHIRAAHNPYSEDFYRLCDEHGILVVDELYDKWLKRYAGGRADWSSLWQRDIPEWVKANRNHPCIVMWSLGNELQTYSNLPFGDFGVTPYRLQRLLLRQYDTTRPTTVAMHPRGRSPETDSLPCELARITDIQAYNYRYMYFEGDGRRFPYMNFYQSEANLVNMGPNYFGMNLDRVIGLAYWGMFDYIGESRGWPAKGWSDGVFDLALQPKPEAWLVKSMFSDEPTVRIAVAEGANGAMEWNGIVVGGAGTSAHWNHDVGDTLTIYAYTNAETAELMLNGRSLGIKKNDKTDPARRNKIAWKGVPYAAGRLEAVARNGQDIVARHAIETAGRAERIVITTDNDNWKADGYDLQHVKITLTDSEGRTAIGDDREVTITVSGDAEIIATCNGDINSDHIYTNHTVKTHNGTAIAILRSGVKGGKVVVEAVVSGIKELKELKELKVVRSS